MKRLTDIAFYSLYAVCFYAYYAYKGMIYGNKLLCDRPMLIMVCITISYFYNKIRTADKKEKVHLIILEVSMIYYLACQNRSNGVNALINPCFVLILLYLYLSFMCIYQFLQKEKKQRIILAIALLGTQLLLYPFIYTRKGSAEYYYVASGERTFQSYRDNPVVLVGEEFELYANLKDMSNLIGKDGASFPWLKQYKIGLWYYTVTEMNG